MNGHYLPSSVSLNSGPGLFNACVKWPTDVAGWLTSEQLSGEKMHIKPECIKPKFRHALSDTFKRALSARKANERAFVNFETD